MKRNRHFGRVVGCLVFGCSRFFSNPDHSTPIPNWQSLINAAFTQRPAPLRALSVVNTWGSASKPAEFTLHDGSTCIVKDGIAKRQCVNDQVVAVLGAALGTPTGRVAHVEVGSELIQATPFLQQWSWQPGVWHGSIRVGDVSERDNDFKYTDLPENRRRFALLAVLYGWAFTRHDQQFLYQKTEPYVVYSVDHGHFFPNGPDWDISQLAAHTIAAAPDQHIVTGAKLTNAELKAASTTLSAIDLETTVAQAVAFPMDKWTEPAFTMDERVALAEYLHRRHGELVQTIAQLPQ